MPQIREQVDYITQAPSYDEAANSESAWAYFSVARCMYLLLTSIKESALGGIAALVHDLAPMATAVLTRTISSMSPLSQLIGIKDSEHVVPIWLSPTILIIDLFERLKLSADARSSLQRSMVDPNATYRWKFSDRRNFSAGEEWFDYDPEHSDALNSAFSLGARDTTLHINGQQYVVDFASMVQTNVNTYNRRRIKREVVPADRPADQPSVARVSSDLRAISISSPLTHPEVKLALVEACTALLKTQLDQEALDSTLRLTLRLTRDNDTALRFFAADALPSLINIRQGRIFKGFGLLISVRRPSILCAYTDAAAGAFPTHH